MRKMEGQALFNYFAAAVNAGDLDAVRECLENDVDLVSYDNGRMIRRLFRECYAAEIDEKIVHLILSYSSLIPLDIVKREMEESIHYGGREYYLKLISYLARISQKINS